MKAVKIAIDISPLIDANSQRGVGYFAKNLVPALQQEIKTNPDYQNWSLSLVKKTPPSDTNYDLIHYPFFDPFHLTLPTKKSTPTIITIYDLMPRQFKKHYPVGARGEIKWLIQRHRAQKTDLIITSSHYSKHIIKDILHYPEDKIYVTHGAANSSFRPIKNLSKLKKVRQKYKLPNKFILYVGDINWNKNIPTLVKACQKLKYPLVIVGGAATKKNIPIHPWTKDLHWLQSQIPHPLIILTGFVPDQDLPVIFNLATTYCQPSFAEGFGLVLVQAMACACPVTFSQEASVPEIMDYNGQMFNPYSQKSLQNALKKLWTNSKLRHQYIKKGLKRAKHFSWSLTAKQTLAVYQVALLQNET